MTERALDSNLDIDHSALVSQIDGAEVFKSAEVYKHPLFAFDSRERTIGANGKKFTLKAREAELLYVLSQVPNFYVPYEQLVKHVLRSQLFLPPSDIRTIQTYVKRLRDKLRELVGDEEIIETLKGSGYRLIDCSKPRVKALSCMINGVGLEIDTESYEHPRFHFVSRERTLSANDRAVRLTVRESALMRILTTTPNARIASCDIAKSVIDVDIVADSDIGNIRVLVFRLRKILRGLIGDYEVIRNVSGGYTLVDESRPVPHEPTDPLGEKPAEPMYLRANRIY